jgi:hypothetical protein
MSNQKKKRKKKQQERVETLQFLSMYTGPISCSDPYVLGAPGPPWRNKTSGAAETLAQAVQG